MKEYKYILLDLDGTITDPMIGITRCVEYALNHFGIQVNDLRELCPFIGPPLLDSFRDFYHFTDEQAKEATEKYRERFADTGIYENKLYDGMKDFLEEATRQGRILMLATSKPTVFAKRILDYFDIARYFTGSARKITSFCIKFARFLRITKKLSKTISNASRSSNIRLPSDMTGDHSIPCFL